MLPEVIHPQSWIGSVIGLQLIWVLVLALPYQRRRQWHPTPVLLAGNSHGWRSLVGCSPWGHEESDMTERLHFTCHFHALEKEMATHSCDLAWRIPGTEEPGGLPSMGSLRVGHDWSDLAAAAVTLPAVKPFWISDSLFIQRGSPCANVGGFKEVSVPSPAHSQGLGLCARTSQGSCSETYETLMFFLSAAFKDLSQLLALLNNDNLPLWDVIHWS